MIPDDELLNEYRNVRERAELSAALPLCDKLMEINRLQGVAIDDLAVRIADLEHQIRRMPGWDQV